MLIRWLSRNDPKKAVVYTLELIQLFKKLESKPFKTNSYIKSLMKIPKNIVAYFIVQRGKNVEDSMNIELNYCFIKHILSKKIVTDKQKLILKDFKNELETLLVQNALKGWDLLDIIYSDLIEWIISKIEDDPKLLETYIEFTKTKQSYILLRCFVSTTDNQKILLDYSKTKTFDVLEKSLVQKNFQFKSVKAQYSINTNGKGNINDKFNYIYHMNQLDEEEKICLKTRLTSENEYCFVGMDINKIDSFEKTVSSIYGIQIFQSERDGNCLFRSCSKQLDLTHDGLRSNVYDLLLKKKESYSERFSDFSEYLEKMKNDGEWGGDLEIIEISNYFNRPIYIFQPNGVFKIFDGEIKFYSHSEFINIQNSKDNPIILIYDGSHYNWGKYQ